MNKNIVIYPGTFKPFTTGHLNVLEKGEDIFGKGNVMVAIGINPSKSEDEDPMSRKRYIEDKIGRKVDVYSCFLHEYVENLEKEGYNVIVLRGLRNGDDLAYENNQLKFIRDFKPDIKMVFVLPDSEFEHISSTSIRQLESFRKGSSKKYLI